MKFEELSNTAKIWVYQADRQLTSEEQSFISQELELFTKEWNTHGTGLVAAGEIIENHFVVLGVDESHMNASGCSIDSSVRFIKSIGQKLNIDFFNRLKLLTISESGALEYVSYAKLKEDESRIVFNPLINSKAQLENNFKTKVSDFLNSQK